MHQSACQAGYKKKGGKDEKTVRQAETELGMREPVLEDFKKSRDALRGVFESLESPMRVSQTNT